MDEKQEKIIKKSVPKYVFPKSVNPVRHDPDLYLLGSRYSRFTDTLRILYKNIKTNEKILDEIVSPSVPVYLNKQMPKFFTDFVPFEETYDIIVNYKNKSREIQRTLFPTKSWKYFDNKLGIEKTSVGFVDMKKETMKKKPEFLHPQLLMADVPIEHLVCMEYCMDRYQEVGDGVSMEVVTPPSLDLASFDIETSMDAAGNPYINLNTFIDDKSMTAYAYYLLSDDYKYQSMIAKYPKQFDKMFRKKFKWAIDNMTLNAKPAKIKLVKDICNNYLENLKIVTKPFKTEGELIMKSCELMFTDNSPDLLMAFNTAYDTGVFNRRITELGLPSGTFNSRKKPSWLTTPPPIMEELNEDWVLRNDTIDPKKRMTRFDNISYTHIVDYANAYYSNRKGATFAAMSLDATANRELGLGKLDYSKIANHVLKLPFNDFVTHTVYGLIDSILLLICEKVTNDFDSKLAYVLRTKSDMKSTASNNQAISRCIHAEAFYSGFIPGNNWKKFLPNFTLSELGAMSKITKIDYKKNRDLYAELPGKEKGDIKGGMVGNPLKIRSAFAAFKAKFNILNGEVNLVRFMKYMYAVYYDLKSHYPNCLVTRNLSKGTMYGDVSRIIVRDNSQVLETARWRDRSLDVYAYTLGGINLTVANDDILTFGHRVLGLPSIGDIASEKIPYDSEPVFQPPYSFSKTLALDKKKYKPETAMSKVLTQLHKEIINKSTKENGMIDARGMFLATDGDTTYMRTYINYDWHGFSMWDAISPNDTENETVFTTFKSGELKIDNRKDIKPEAKPPVFDGEYTYITEEEIKGMAEATSFTYSMKFGGNCAYVPMYQMYFPFKHYTTQKERDYETKGSNKYVIVSGYRYRIIKRTKTYATELKYDITHEDYKLTITQVIDWVNLK